MDLGKIKEVSLRDIWPNEQYDFSTWLAAPENLEYLSSILHLSLTDVATEKPVGNFRCDIFCKDETTGKSVLIENELEESDHKHLGELLTYASGLNASAIVWIVKKARPEHASAIAWLNENMAADISFFLIEVHAIKINDSIPAPQFRVIEEPNDFVNDAKETKTVITETQNYRLEFWTMMNDELKRRNEPFNIRKATTDHWYDVAMGDRRCHGQITLVNNNNLIRLGIWIPNDKTLFDYFYEHKDEIEAETGIKFNWDRKEDDVQASAFLEEIPGLSLGDKQNYPKLIDRLIDDMVKLKKAVKKLLKSQK